MSTKPGVTKAPPASISRRPLPSTEPTSAIRPSLMATSAVRTGPSLPSTTVPPRITRSNDMVPPSADAYEYRRGRAGRQAPTGGKPLGHVLGHRRAVGRRLRHREDEAALGARFGQRL